MFTFIYNILSYFYSANNGKSKIVEHQAPTKIKNDALNFLDFDKAIETHFNNISSPTIVPTEDEKIEKLYDLGFHYLPKIKEYLESMRKKRCDNEYKTRHLEIYNYFSKKYSDYRIVNREDLHNILDNHGFTPIIESNFNEDLPDKIFNELVNLKIDPKDRTVKINGYERVRNSEFATPSFGSGGIYSSVHYPTPTEFYSSDTQNIIVSYLGYVRMEEGKDIVHSVKEYYLIVALWDKNA
jgi:hypothetical protein